MRPITLITGEETILALQARQAWLDEARALGFDERSRYDAAELDWEDLSQHIQHLSLFAPKRLLEVHHHEERQLSRAGEACLRQWPAQEDCLLLIFAPRFEKVAQSAWFKALGERIQHHHFKKMTAREFEKWVQEELKKHQLYLSAEAFHFLLQSCANNAVAFWQCLQHLVQQDKEQNIGIDFLKSILIDAAIHQSYALSDAILLGQWKQALLLAQQLPQRLSDSEKQKLQIALTSQIQKDCTILLHLHEHHHQEEKSAFLQAHRIPAFKHKHYYQALNIHSLKQLHMVLRLCAQLDALSKGAAVGHYWQTLSHYLLFRLRHHV